MDVSISSAERRGDGPLVTSGESLGVGGPHTILTIANNLFNRRHRTGRVKRVRRWRTRKVLLRSRFEEVLINGFEMFVALLTP